MTGMTQIERIPAALDGFISDFSNQLDRLAKNNSRLKSANERFIIEESLSGGVGSPENEQGGLIPKLQKCSELLRNLLTEQENQIEKIERFI